jgi:hypothetical protein
MALSASNVRVFGTGGSSGGAVFHAPLGTALPTDTTTALNVAFVDCGYISEDGIVETQERTNTDVRAFGGDLVRRITSEFGLTFTFSMLEHNANSVGAFYGNGSATAWEIKYAGVRKAWVIWVVDSVSSKIRRIAVTDGEVTDVQPVTYATDAPIMYGVTVTAYPNASGVYGFSYQTA